MDGLSPVPNPVTPAPGPSALTGGPQPGIEAQAQIKVRQAVMLLADAVGVLKQRLDGDLAQAVLTSLRALSKYAPGVEEGLGQSEVASLLSGMSGVRRPGAPAANFLGMRPPAMQPMRPASMHMSSPVRM